MDVKRILENSNIVALIAEANAGKSMVLCNIITEYITAGYPGKIRVFGMSPQVIEQFGDSVELFSSLLEFERMEDSVIIIDEMSNLFDFTNRSKHSQIEQTLRMVYHRNNKIILSGLPDNFKKFVSSLAGAIMFKSLNLDSLINGSYVKKILDQYQGYEKGAYTLLIPKNQVLCYANSAFWLDDVVYLEQFDTKRNNLDLLSVS